MSRPLLLDLFCCEGGAAVGYHRAGFDVIGVDIEPQPNYPFRFVQADALAFLDRMLAGGTWEWIGPGIIQAYHASCPCQRFCDLAKRNGNADDWPDLIDPTRERLMALSERWGTPYVIENVEGAPLRDPVMLCGTMFPELRVIRHRLFETNWPLEAPPHVTPHPLVFTHDKRKAHYGKLDQDTSYVQVTGGGNATLAIPPAYTEWIGRQLLDHRAVHS